MTKRKSQGAMTKPALGTSVSLMPSPPASALADAVFQPTCITTLKFMSHNTVLLIQNLIHNSLIKWNSDPLLLSCIYPWASYAVMRPSFSTGSNPSSVALESFAILVRSVLSWVFNHCIKCKLERQDPVKRSLPNLSVWKAVLLNGVIVLQHLTYLNPNFNPATNWFSYKLKFLATKRT